MAFTDYRDLEVWRLGCNLVKRTHEATRAFPDDERFGLISQLRRASVSIPSNIAEGWGRRYTMEFVLGLRRANGSRVEVETQIVLSRESGFISGQMLESLLAETGLLGRKLLSLERSLLRTAGLHPPSGHSPLEPGSPC